MDELTTTATPPDVGAATESAVQGTPTTSQEASKPQNSGTVSVDSGVQPTASKSEERPKSSDFYRRRERERREREQTASKIANLERQLAETTALLKKPPAGDPPKKNGEEKFWANPYQTLEESLKEQEERLLKKQEELLEKGIQERLSQREQQIQREANTRAALEMIFPKTKEYSQDSWEARADANPQRAELVRKLLDETGLEMVSQSDPMKAAKTLLKLLDAQNPAPVMPKNPLAPTKAQMASTATSNGKGGTKTVQTLQEVAAQLGKLTQTLGEEPQKRFDETFMNELKTVKDAYLKLSQTGNQQ